MSRKAERALPALAAAMLVLAGGVAAKDPVPAAPATIAPAVAPAPATGTPAAAAPAASAGPAGRLKGPIKITAQRAELENRKSALYRGNVKLTADDLTLTGERLELKQPVRGQFSAEVTGAPARLVQAAAGDAPAVSASAGTIVYDTQSAVVALSNGAHLERGTDRLSGDSIKYDVVARRISASGSGTGQVEIVIQPPAGALQPRKTDTPPKP